MWKFNLLEKRQFTDYLVFKQLAIHLKENTVRTASFIEKLIPDGKILNYFKIEKIEFRI